MVEGNLSNIPMKVECNWQAVWEELEIFSSGGHFVHQSETILAILVEGYLSNIRMKFELNRPKGIG